MLVKRRAKPAAEPSTASAGRGPPARRLESPDGRFRPPPVRPPVRCSVIGSERRGSAAAGRLGGLQPQRADAGRPLAQRRRQSWRVNTATELLPLVPRSRGDRGGLRPAKKIERPPAPRRRVAPWPPAPSGSVALASCKSPSTATAPLATASARKRLPSVRRASGHWPQQVAGAPRARGPARDRTIRSGLARPPRADTRHRRALPKRKTAS